MHRMLLGLLVLPACSARAEPLGEIPAFAVAETPTAPSEPPAADGVEPPVRPALRVLGTAQDGGLPHAGCACVACEAAREHPDRARRVASVAAITVDDRGGSHAFLIDATPDIHEQLHDLHTTLGRPAGAIDRAPVDAILLTHAHIGHYLGLSMLGFEALHTSSMPLWTSARMGQLLRDNAPWDQLVRLHNVELQTATPERAIELAPTVRATPVLVPHRDEYTDTLGFVLEGPRRKLLYVPDSAPWSAWSPALPDFLRARDIDVALLDGTFYSGDELPGRDLSTLAHPLMVDTMQLLQPLVDAGEVRVWFTHLNHSNPALDPEGPARAEILRRGFAVADDGLELPM